MSESNHSDDTRIALLERETEQQGKTIDGLNEECKENASLIRMQQRTVDLLNRSVEAFVVEQEALRKDIRKIRELPLEALKDLPKKVEDNARITGVAKWVVMIVLAGLVNVLLKDFKFFG